MTSRTQCRPAAVVAALVPPFYPFISDLSHRFAGAALALARALTHLIGAIHP